ncbi:MAG: serine hydrolase [Bacteroidota bacterium]
MKIFFSFFIFIFLSITCTAQDTAINPTDIPNGSLEEAGLNQDTIQHLMQLLNETKYRDFRGMVVIKDNKLVVEEYFNTFWRANILDIRSAGKSITALLLGIAIDQGLIKDVEQPVYDFFPKYKLNNPPTEAHLGIKIKHLLMMSSGMDADSDDSNSPGNAGQWMGGDDWVGYALNVPMKFESGTRWVYNDICAVLTGAIIQEVSGKKLSEFAEEHLFDPLGIEEYYWYTGPKELTGGAGNLYFSAYDFAKFGLLVLNKGKYNGEQIVSEKWIGKMTQKWIDMPADYTASHYGFFWYIAEIEINGKMCEYFFASGNGGNYIFVVPDHDLAVALTSSAYGPGHGHGRSRAIFRYILNSIIGK